MNTTTPAIHPLLCKEKGIDQKTHLGPLQHNIYRLCIYNPAYSINFGVQLNITILREVRIQTFKSQENLTSEI